MAVQRRERKVVTVVFCDLVGFTQRAEKLDPEDVEALLTPYHERLRSELERYGGTVEKFIGDAVMALFGAPVAHEDDPERAVRACLAIRDWAIEEEDVQVRIAVTTGEALIRLDARPEAGEGMASGDVVNTAARLQNAAPVNGILTDDTTYRATRRVVDYGEAPAVEAKGKANRSRLGSDQRAGSVRRRRRARGSVEPRRSRPRARCRPGRLRPGPSRTHAAAPHARRRPGHRKEPSRVRAPAHRRRRPGAHHLAPGTVPRLWRRRDAVGAQRDREGAGRHPRAGHSGATLRRRCASAAADALPEADAAWVESQLLALVGLGVERELGDDRRNEAFSAWRRFLEGLAEQRPFVLVFEDLHWADESLLDFVDELVDWVTDVPLLVVATARPELLERRPGWAGGKLNATTLALAPLSDDETALLLSGLLGRPVLAAESQQALLERAGGNPLYAEQFAELYVERGSTDELPLPETLQGIIAARLDGLAETEKNLVLDAAVVGKVFWPGSLGRNGDDVVPALHALERKGFVRRQRRSSVEGESELAFAHALVRDVAYGQIPRADRSAKHRRVAEWIESLGRSEDHAEMLAYHWSSALELARASGRDDAAIAERARHALSEAGDRAFALNAHGPAARYLSAALSLSTPDDSDYAQLLFRRARALHLAAAEGRDEALIEARDALLETGDRESAGEAEALLSQGAWYRGSRDESHGHMTRALELVAESEPSTAKARVLAMSARLRMLADENEEAIRIANEALTIADSLELDEIRAHALTTRGASLNKVDSTKGRTDVEDALRIAIDANSPIAAVVANNLAVLATWRGDLREAGGLYVEAGELAKRFGDENALRFTRGNVIYSNFFLGEWDTALASADEFIAECETSPHYMEGGARNVRSFIRFARGDTVGALEDMRINLAQAREIMDPQRLLPSLENAARLLCLAGRREEALAHAREAIDFLREHVALAGALGELVIVVDELGLRDEILEILDRAPPGPWVEVVRAGASGDFVRACELYASFGASTLLAEANLLAGEALIGSGRRGEGVSYLEDALAFYRSVGATYFVRRAEVLLPASA